jgi:multidrug efflux system membrane fusion protein
MKRARFGAAIPGGMLVLASVLAQAPTYVRFTPAVEHSIRSFVRLPGTVESRFTSVVAGQAAGVVIALEVRAGDRVEKEQPLAQLRRSFYEVQLQAAQGLRKEADARLELAASQLRRAQDLFGESVVSQADLDDALSEHTAWLGRLDQSQAEIDRLELVLEYCTVRAPFRGVVVAKRTDVGQWIGLGDPVMEMVSLDELRVRVDVPERYYDLVEPGVDAGVSFEALPQLGVTGSVDRVIPSANPRSRTFPVQIGLENVEGRIAVGMLAEVALPVGATVRALVVPKDAVVRDGTAEVLFRIRDDETVEAVPVTSGRGAGSWVVVTGDVAEGDRVVTRGNERLRDGQSVRAEPLEYELP